MKKTYKVSGMHCASCVLIIKGELDKIPGISEAQINLLDHSSTIQFADKELSLHEINKKIKPLGYQLLGDQEANSNSEESSLDKEHPDYLQAKRDLQISLPFTIIATILMLWMLGAEYQIFGIPSMSEEIHHFINHQLFPLMATIVIIGAGKEYLRAVWIYIRYGKATMDTLVGIGTLFAYLFSLGVTFFGEQLSKYIDPHRVFYEASIVVIGFIAIGKFLEQQTSSKTGKAIKSLLNLQAKKARILLNGESKEVAIEEIKLGDMLLVLPGEKIPLDGKIIKGEAHLDESMITGESLPVSKKREDEVIGATILLDAPLEIQTTAIGTDTYLSKIIQVVEEAKNSKPQIQYKVDKIMKIFIPIVLGIAILSTILWLRIAPKYMDQNLAIRYAIQAFIGVLVIACPCGLGLATPMAIVTGMGHAAKNGILAKNADGLIKLRKVKYIAFDKTGTITEGKPTLSEQLILKKDQDPDLALQILASLEASSTHPIAHAIQQYFQQQNGVLLELERAQNHPGEGISGEIQGVRYFVGNAGFAEQQGLQVPEEYRSFAAMGKTPILLFDSQEIIAVYAVADNIKTSALTTIQELKTLGIIPIMITGDHHQTAQYVAAQVGIDQVYAEVKPTEKATTLQNIRSQLQEEETIAMLGDGINDAPALATADIGIAMSTGTDVAIESADITLLHGDLSKLLKAIKISQLTQSAINQNLIRAFGYNLIGIPLAAGGFYPFTGWMLNPAFEGMAMAFSDLTVVGNSLRLQAKKI